MNLLPAFLCLFQKREETEVVAVYIMTKTRILTTLLFKNEINFWNSSSSIIFMSEGNK